MSCVYMISCRDEKVPEIYIGSTNDYIRRRKEHFYRCRNINCKSYNYKLYRFIRSNGGIDNFIMEILERCYEDEDKFEIEKKYIRSYAPELNSYKYEIDKKKRQKNKEKQKKYYDKNKEKLIEKQKKYYDKNKEELIEKQKKYYENNKEKVSEKQKKYYEKNKEKKINNMKI